MILSKKIIKTKMNKLIFFASIITLSNIFSMQNNTDQVVDKAKEEQAKKNRKNQLSPIDEHWYGPKCCIKKIYGNLYIINREKID